MMRCEIVNNSVECIIQPVEGHVEQDLDDKNHGENYIHSDQEASDHDDEATFNEKESSATSEQKETMKNQATLDPKSAQEEGNLRKQYVSPIPSHVYQEQDLDVQKKI